MPLLELEVSTSGKPTRAFETFNPPVVLGDRILVARYASGSRERFQVLAFEFPDRPKVPQGQELLYVKRLVGLPGETVGIHGGRLYLTDQLKYPAAAGVSAEDLRLPEQMHPDDPEAVKQLRADLSGGGPRKFTILRKPHDLYLAPAPHGLRQ